MEVGFDMTLNVRCYLEGTLGRMWIGYDYLGWRWFLKYAAKKEKSMVSELWREVTCYVVFLLLCWHIEVKSA